MRVWDRATGTCIATLTGHTEPVNSVAISPTGPGSPRISHPVSLRGDHVCRGPRVVPTPARHRPPRESSTGTELRSELENRRSVRSNSGFQRGVSGQWPPYSSVVSARVWRSCRVRSPFAGLHSPIAPSAFPPR
ncbi:hypothetical protein ACFV2I_38010 [Streptomyces microflavus]|uniref:Uncharacterized protein n=1 Tax=Streptomyces microflavus TaxID=1919 RepID=A0A7H8N0J7_STRMI|nr:hypothetical protein HUT09_36410 [Streptomyces microflavus]